MSSDAESPDAESEAGAPDEASAEPSEPSRAPSAEPSAAATRPTFAKDWPRDSELDRLLVAFDGGDYALVKRDAPQVAERATDELVRRAAHELLKRTQPDPLSSLLILVASGLLAFFAYWFYTHGH